MFKAVPDYEALLRLRETDPAQFEAVVTQGGLRLSVVQYQRDRETAIAEGTNKPDGESVSTDIERPDEVVRPSTTGQKELASRSTTASARHEDCWARSQELPA